MLKKRCCELVMKEGGKSLVLVAPRETAQISLLYIFDLNACFVNAIQGRAAKMDW